MHYRARQLKILLTGAALLLSTLTAVRYAGWRSEIAELEELARTLGTDSRHPDLGRELRRRPDPGQARLILARMMLADELDPAWRNALPAEERLREAELGFERLAVAQRLSEATLRDHPASWEAAMILGGTRFLELSRRHDPELARSPQLWEDPLELAHELSPAQPEPIRLLAAAYIGNWSRLSAAKRSEASEMIRQAFTRRKGFDLLLEPWLRTAPTLEAALAPVPDEPEAWQRVAHFYLQETDLERYRDAHSRWYRSLRPEMLRRLEQARTWRRAGDHRRADQHFLSILGLPPDRQFIDLFESALAETRIGSLAGAQQRSPRSWLLWAQELCIHLQCPLQPAGFEVLSRLLGDLGPDQKAFAYLAAGNLTFAELYDERMSALESAQWAPYFLFKTRWLSARQQTAEARLALARVDPGLKTSTAYRLAKAEIAESGSDPLEKTGMRPPSGATGPQTPFRRWAGADATIWYEAVSPGDTAGFSIEVLAAPQDGAVAHLQVDGSTAGIFFVREGDHIVVDHALAAGLHLIQIRNPRGRPPTLGPIKLRSRIDSSS